MGLAHSPNDVQPTTITPQLVVLYQDSRSGTRSNTTESFYTDHSSRSNTGEVSFFTFHASPFSHDTFVCHFSRLAL